MIKHGKTTFVLTRTW